MVAPTTSKDTEMEMSIRVAHNMCHHRVSPLERLGSL